MAKHQVSGKAKSIALTPGYGCIKKWCGSLEYELEAEQVIFGNISRREIAEAMRYCNDCSQIPAVETIADFGESRKTLLTKRFRMRRRRLLAYDKADYYLLIRRPPGGIRIRCMLLTSRQLRRQMCCTFPRCLVS
jgi:hypothetical protein